jgi:Tol biopolymer transport system component
MPLTPGMRLGPYEILAAIGAGGMGEVYRARDTRLDRVVAIKVLPDHLARDPALRARFEREARAVSSLNHPHICSLYDIGQQEGTDYLVLEHLEGETLDARLARGSLPVAEAIELAGQIASALDAAHEKGILHRDLKPANVMLTSDRQAKVLDFGLAKNVSRSGDPGTSDSPTATEVLTGAGGVMGTAPYMSPEQARGGQVDRRTDVWSFGCVLYEMLTGRCAFQRGSVSETLAAILKEEPHWDVLPAATPAALRRLLVRCLDKDPKRRLRDVGDARLELEEAQAGGAGAPATGRPATPRPWSAIVAWCVASVAVLVTIGTLVRAHVGGLVVRAPMRFSVVTNFAGVEAGPSLSPDGRSVAFVSNRDGQWDIYVGLVTGGSLIRITNDPNVETRPRWSPDGANLLFARLNDLGNSDVWVVPALGGVARRIVLNGLHPAWSPDGRTIAYSSGGVLWTCEASGANPRAVTAPELSIAHYQPAFSHDGRSLAFVRRREGPYSELSVADLRTGATKALTSDNALALSPVWSPDDRFIYFTSSRGGTLNIWKTSVVPGVPEQITAGRGDDTDIDLSADGKRLVFSTYRANVNLAELSLDTAPGRRLRWLTSDSARGELSPRYSPDGRRIAYFSNREGAETESIRVMDADGGNASGVGADSRVNAFPRWTADGQELMFMSRAPGIEQTTPEVRRIAMVGGAAEVLPMKTWGPEWGDISADGRLVYRTSPGAGEIYDPRTNQREPVPDMPGGPFWSRDGRSFAFIVRPDPGTLLDAGLWIQGPDGARRRVFQGWVASFAWMSSGELLVLEGKPDLKGVLWRIEVGGQRKTALTEVPLMMSHIIYSNVPGARFDVHPDARRIAIEEFEYLESDIGMIDNVR